MEHSAFFASLVDLVPAEHYLPSESPQVNLRYLKRSAREAAKAELRKKRQRDQRARLDPMQTRTTQERQRELVAEEAEERHEEGVSTSVPEEAAKGRKASATSPSGPAGPRLALQGAAQSREELRERLQAKLHGLRAQRHVDEKQAGDEEARTWREKKLGKSRQAAQSKRNLQAALQDDGAEQQRKKRVAGRGDEAPDASATAAAEDFAFSRIIQAEEMQEKKGLSKKALLALAEAKQKTDKTDETAVRDLYWGWDCCRSLGLGCIFVSPMHLINFLPLSPRA